MTEPVDVADIKRHLRIDASDVDDDVYLSALIVAARSGCEKKINRSVVGKTATLVLDRFPAISLPWQIPVEVRDPRVLEITLEGGTVSAVTGITYVDGTGSRVTLDPSQYRASLLEEPARLSPVTNWPAAAVQPGSVIVSYTISPLDADDLAAVSHAIRLLVGGWYANRESSVIDTRGTPTELPLSVTWLLEGVRQFATS